MLQSRLPLSHPPFSLNGIHGQDTWSIGLAGDVRKKHEILVIDPEEFAIVLNSYSPSLRCLR